MAHIMVYRQPERSKNILFLFLTSGHVFPLTYVSNLAGVRPKHELGMGKLTKDFGHGTLGRSPCSSCK